MSASSSIADWALAAVRLKVCFSRSSPPTSIAAPSTSRMLPMIEPTIEAFTTSCSPSLSAKKAMISSGALPKVTFRKPADARAGLGGDVLGGLAHHGRGGDHAERGGAEHQHRRGVRELERDGERDEDA